MWHIILLSILAVIVLSITIHIWRHLYKDIDNSAPLPMPKDEGQLRTIISQLPVQLIANEGTEFTVAFQGGQFILRYKPINDSFELQFPNIASVTCEELPCALLAANTINNKYSIWQCSLFPDKIGKSEKPWYVSLSCYVPLFDNPQTLTNLEASMGMSFYIARDFDELFDKERHQNNLSPERLQSADFRNALALAQNRWATMSHTPNTDDTNEVTPENASEDTGNRKPIAETNGDPLTIQRLMALWTTANFGALVSLRILAGDNNEKITRADEILDFDICDFIRRHHTADWALDFSLQLTTENEGLLFCLRRDEGCTDKTLFYTMQIYRTGLASSFNLEAYFSNMRIEIRLTSPDNDLWETKYMIDEALAKAENEDFDLLSDTEKAIVTMTTDSLRAHMYWGKRYFTAKCLSVPRTFPFHLSPLPR